MKPLFSVITLALSGSTISFAASHNGTTNHAAKAKAISITPDANGDLCVPSNTKVRDIGGALIFKIKRDIPVFVGSNAIFAQDKKVSSKDSSFEYGKPRCVFQLKQKVEGEAMQLTAGRVIQAAPLKTTSEPMPKSSSFRNFKSTDNGIALVEPWTALYCDGVRMTDDFSNKKYEPYVSNMSLADLQKILGDDIQVSTNICKPIQ